MLQLGAVQLGHRRFGVRNLASRLHGGHTIRQQPSRLELDRQLGQLVPHAGIVQEAPAVRLRLRRVLHQLFVQTDARHHAVDAGALEVQGGRCHVPAPVQLAHQAAPRDAHVIEEYLVESVPTQYVQQRPHLHAGRIHVQEEVADPPVLGRFRVSAGQQDAPVGAVGQRRPYFLAVDDEVIAVGHRRRLKGGQVGAGAGLAEPLAPHRLPGDEARQVMPLLLVRAVKDDCGAHAVRPHAELSGRSEVGHLLAVDDLRHVAGGQSAVFLRPAQRQPFLGGQLLLERAQELPARFAGLAQCAGALPVGWELASQELAYLAAEPLLFRRESELHALTSVWTASVYTTATGFSTCAPFFLHSY